MKRIEILIILVVVSFIVTVIPAFADDTAHNGQGEKPTIQLVPASQLPISTPKIVVRIKNSSSYANGFKELIELVLAQKGIEIVQDTMAKPDYSFFGNCSTTQTAPLPPDVSVLTLNATVRINQGGSGAISIGPVSGGGSSVSARIELSGTLYAPGKGTFVIRNVSGYAEAKKNVWATAQTPWSGGWNTGNVWFPSGNITVQHPNEGVENSILNKAADQAANTLVILVCEVLKKK